MPWRPTPVLALTLLACTPRTGPVTTGLSGGDNSTTASTDGGDATAASTSTGAASTTSGASAATTSAGATSYPMDDLGVPDMGEVKPACNGKIDVVFVIPDGDEYFEAAMPKSLPAFAETMTTTLADFDLHVMALDAEGVWGAPKYCPKDKCPADGPCPALEDPDFPCWALHDATALTKCDDTLGSGVTFPAGMGASNVRCPVPEGRRYLTRDDPDFAATFLCVSTQGWGTGIERGPESLLRMVSDDLQFGCNAGFLREDALLLVFLVSSSDGSAYSPPVWANAILEAKGGDDDMVVVMALSGDLSTENPLCPGPKVDEPHDIYKFALLFEHGLIGSLCATDYGPYFEEAALLASELCDSGPQG